MRDYLQDLNIIGATMVYREGNQCRWSIDWLLKNCNKIIILLDNFDEHTLQIILDYRDKYPDIIQIVYSKISVSDRCNKVQGQSKRRFKLNQDVIREQVIQELHRINKEELKVDLFSFFDSDEIPINQFPYYLEKFWYEIKDRQFMQIGFVEVFESFRIILSQRMSPHGRVYKYNPEMSALPYSTRTIYRPFELGRPWKVRHLLVHLCHFNEEYRKRRQFADNIDFWERKRDAWLLPRDVRTMSVEEISQYQPGYHGSPPMFPSIPLEEIVNNKSKYEEYFI